MSTLPFSFFALKDKKGGYLDLLVGVLG